MALWSGGWTARALAGAGLLVGRSNECDVRIDEASVSRRHVFVHVEPRLELEDLGGVAGHAAAPHDALAHVGAEPLALGEPAVAERIPAVVREVLVAGVLQPVVVALGEQERGARHVDARRCAGLEGGAESQVLHVPAHARLRGEPW